MQLSATCNCPPANNVSIDAAKPLAVVARDLRRQRAAGQRISPARAQAFIARMKRQAPRLYAQVLQQGQPQHPDQLAGLGASLLDRLLDTAERVGDVVSDFTPIWKTQTGTITSTPTASLGVPRQGAPTAAEVRAANAAAAAAAARKRKSAVMLPLLLGGVALLMRSR